MGHMILARKWRPKKFADLIGQQSSVTILRNILHGTRLHHAYLLTGTRGVGKTTIARIIAKVLNCINQQEGEPCCDCNNCIQIDQGSFIDVIEIDAASNTGVDNIRELIENAQYAPTAGKYKVYIIDEVHMLSKSAFNALLKTLEEPPEHIVFVLATTDIGKVPITVLSRCLQLKLRNLLADEIADYLLQVLNTENEQAEANALKLIATAAHGSMRDALSLLDQAIAYSKPIITETAVRNMLGLASDEEIYTILNALISQDAKALLAIAERIYMNGVALDEVLSNLQHKLCAINIAQLSKNGGNGEINHYVNNIAINDVQLYFEIASLGIKQLAATEDKYPVFIMTLLRLLAFNLGNNEQKTVLLNRVDEQHKTAVSDNTTLPNTETHWQERVAKLKEEQQIKQVAAADALENDPYLLQLCGKMSATIMPESIKYN